MAHNESELVKNNGNTLKFSCIPRLFESPRRKEKIQLGNQPCQYFFCIEFNGLFKDMHCIDMALLFDPTIMIVGRPLCANEVAGFCKTISWTKDVAVTLAITFLMEQGMNVAHQMWFGCWWHHQMNQTISNFFLEASRFWMFDVDNAH
jgi:hypothetical protein